MSPIVAGSEALPAGSSLPAGTVMLYAQMVENARDDEVHQFGDLCRTMIEAGRGGHYDGAGPRDPQHVLEVNGAERRLARHQDEGTPVLERKVGPPPDRPAPPRAPRPAAPPARLAESVPMEHGQITMPALSADPDAGAAPRSPS